MPFVVSPQNRIHISMIDNVEREVPVIGNLIIFFLDALDLARKYLASDCLNLIDQGMHFKIANLS